MSCVFLRSDVGRRLVVLLRLGGNLSGGHSTIFWNSRCMNRNSGFALNTSRIASFVGIVVEVLMHAAVLDDHHVAGLPLEYGGRRARRGRGP